MEYVKISIIRRLIVLLNIPKHTIVKLSNKVNRTFILKQSLTSYSTCTLILTVL